MRIFLNDFELNNPSNQIFLDEMLEGFEMPAIRSSRGNRSGQSGSYFGAQLFDARHITINGRVFSEDVTTSLQKRRDIQAALPLFPAQIELRMIDDDGRAYIMFCQVMDFKMPIKRQRFQHAFKIELEAPDPVIYDDTAGTELSATIQKAVAGGMLFSASTPTFGVSTHFTAGMPNTTVDNTSDITIYPVITITGQTTNPAITNLATGEKFYMTSYSVDSSAVTVIDMMNHTTTLNGSNVLGNVPIDSDWVGLVPGLNEFLFESDSSTDASSAVLTWRPGFMGI
ncbi:phage distal tail protein [Streptomyces turgidiscabies]|uniref:phage distal tail protein n=1 Tax=Streptomyces turgidiscabies TaxID=85558 RepID=UPI0038F6691C